MSYSISPKCPFCGKNQTQNPIKTWAYGKMIEKRTSEKTTMGASVNCSRYECKCGKLFNFYVSPKKNWTIPKSKN